MKFGVRECCDVVLRAKGTQKSVTRFFIRMSQLFILILLKPPALKALPLLYMRRVVVATLV